MSAWGRGAGSNLYQDLGSWTRLPLGRFVLGLWLFLGLAGCDEPATDLRSAIELWTAEQGEVAERAWPRIAQKGRAALPSLEAALHRVALPGRRNVVTALRRLALPESAALLGHIAAFDTDAVVRSEAYRTLETWAAGPVTPHSRPKPPAAPCAWLTKSAARPNG